MGKAIMPEVGKAVVGLKLCELYLAKSKHNSRVYTVVKVNEDSVLFIDSDGSLSRGTYSYFSGAYEIIRQYEVGETLSITV